MLHQGSTEIIGAGSCWLILLLGWAVLLLSTTLCLQIKARGGAEEGILIWIFW
jgi:hypothetical protein